MCFTADWKFKGNRTNRPEHVLDGKLLGRLMLEMVNAAGRCDEIQFDKEVSVVEGVATFEDGRTHLLEAAKCFERVMGRETNDLKDVIDLLQKKGDQVPVTVGLVAFPEIFTATLCTIMTCLVMLQHFVSGQCLLLLEDVRDAGSAITNIAQGEWTFPVLTQQLLEQVSAKVGEWSHQLRLEDTKIVPLTVVNRESSLTQHLLRGIVKFSLPLAVGKGKFVLSRQSSFIHHLAENAMKVFDPLAQKIMPMFATPRVVPQSIQELVLTMADSDVLERMAVIKYEQPDHSLLVYSKYLAEKRIRRWTRESLKTTQKHAQKSEPSKRRKLSILRPPPLIVPPRRRKLSIQRPEPLVIPSLEPSKTELELLWGSQIPTTNQPKVLDNELETESAVASKPHVTTRQPQNVRTKAVPRQSRIPIPHATRNPSKIAKITGSTKPRVARPTQIPNLRQTRNPLQPLKLNTNLNNAPRHQTSLSLPRCSTGQKANTLETLWANLPMKMKAPEPRAAPRPRSRMIPATGIPSRIPNPN